VPSMMVEVLMMPQPVGAMFDWLLSGRGLMMPGRRAAFEGEIGVLSKGMSTIERPALGGGVPVQRFTAGDAPGTRLLLEMMPQGSELVML
jgi:hypothetical protein